MEDEALPSLRPRSTRRQRLAWCLYDFANSAFPTVIVTAVYVIYFKSVVVGGDEPGRSDHLWGLANSLAALLVFLTVPLLGAIADRAGRKRALMIGFAALSIAATASLSLTGEGTVLLAIILFVAAAVGFESSCVFYNAFLPELVPANRMERLSGAGWALGYLGGLGCLLAVMPLASERPRLVPLVVAAWFAVFAVPAFAALRDLPRPNPPAGTADAFRQGLTRFLTTIRRLRRHRQLTRFLLSYFFYNNAVLTIIVFAVAFSSDSLGFSSEESILLIVAMNVVAAPGAYVFGHVAERFGAKHTIVATLLIWLAVVAGAELAVWPGLFTTAQAKGVFWGVAGLASLGIGAIQATSRTFVGQLAPAGRSGEFFGFMAFAGKGSAVLGPYVFGWTSDTFDSQRAAVATIGAFFLVGLVLMARVANPR